MASRHGRLGTTAHTMVGPGGEIVEPKSESNELNKVHHDITKALRMLPANGYDAIGEILRDSQLRVLRLMGQVSAGYHRNPGMGGFKIVREIGSDVHDIRYTHAKNGEDFEHVFNGEVEVHGIIRNGKRELLLSHQRGLPLWDDFPE